MPQANPPQFAGPGDGFAGREDRNASRALPDKLRTVALDIGVLSLQAEHFDIPAH